MPALDTVGKVIAYARALLQDTYAPAYRYPDIELINSLNAGLLDARRLRPDLFLYTPTDVPFYTSDDDLVGIPENPPLPTVLDEAITIDQQYRLALVYFVVGQTQIRDEEEVQDARAILYLSKFAEMLTSPLMPQSIPRGT